MPNEKKFSFIIERKDERLYGKLMESLTQLEVPAGYQADIIDVQGCTGRAAAYNAGMQRSDAKYKLYVTEDCILLRHDLLYKLLEIFQSDSQIGLIGCSGAEVLPTSGLTFDARKRLGKLRFASGGNNIGTDFSSSVKDAEALDDFFLATQYDLIWREDLFPAGESFVATAACMEFRRQGYRCTVPKEDEAWLEIANSKFMIDQENQRIFLDEYSGDLYPLVTILIPTYNRPKLFCAALESALHQTYRNLEIFITDNSTDTRTRDIMQDYLARDPRIIYEHHPEYDCARQNWRRARSYNNPKAEYVNWLMDDDLFHPEKIATMIDAYREIDGLSLVTSYRQCIDIHGNPLPDLPTTEPICDKTSVFPGDAVGKKLLMGMDNFIGEPTTVLIKKEYLHHNDLGWSGKEGRFFISDYPTWLQLATKGNTLYIREPLSYFRQHEDQSQRKPELILRGLICIGLEIAYARETGHFLSKDEDYEHAILNWMKSMVASLINIRNANYQMDNLHFLKEIGGNLLLDRPGEIKIPQ